MTTPTQNTPAGTRVEVQVVIGAIPHHARQFACTHWAPDPRTPGSYSGGCKCGTCDGVVELRTGTYQGTKYYADNSVEGAVVLDTPLANGQAIHRVHFDGPHGDICY